MDDGFFGNIRNGFQLFASYLTGSFPHKAKMLSIVREMKVVRNPLTKIEKPSARSGHRIFVDRDFLYVIGGFHNDDNEPKILREVWRYNFFTEIWEDIPTNDSTFPSALASFSMAQTATDRPQALIFGGTAVPFGVTSSKDVHLLDITGETADTHNLLVRGDKLGTYGQAMCRSTLDNETYYVVGGTTGNLFYLDVHELKKENGNWKWRQLNDSDFHDGLYRLEIVHDGVNDKLAFFGGGTPHRVEGFEAITIFNLKTLKYGTMNTYPDGVHGYPVARRCHSIVQWGRRVYMCGGCQDEEPHVDQDNVSRGVKMFNDIWYLDLDSKTWVRHSQDLKTAVFFHDAAITSDGEMFIWGGVRDSLSRVRTDDGQSIWLTAPSLKTLAARAVRDNFKSLFADGFSKYRMTRILNIVKRVLGNYNLLSEMGDGAVPA